MSNPRQPMAEVFGFRIEDLSESADRHRRTKLCPYGNNVPSCTKDKASDPLGVCSVFHHGQVACTCPVRFREDWLIADEAAAFFFAPGTRWTSLTEVRLRDAYGKAAGNIDLVLVAYDGQGAITDFASVEVQAVYISGNIRRAFATYMSDPAANTELDWRSQTLYPRADFLSSSRKRLVPQLMYKGSILKQWGKKQMVVLDRAFYDTLPPLTTVDPSEADLAWAVYDFILDDKTDRYRLTHNVTYYTRFDDAMKAVSVAEAGPVGDFLSLLQEKLDELLEPTDLTRRTIIENAGEVGEWLS